MGDERKSIDTPCTQEYLKGLVDCLEKERVLKEEEFAALLDNWSGELAEYLFAKARCIRKAYYGNKVYVRGLIEFTNYCRNDCYYCGVRRSSQQAERYRLSQDEILECCQLGYELGFRTFVLQGGEDGYYTRQRLADIIRSIRKRWPDCAITLSVGEHSYETYLAWKEAGADRYLLRHETADASHYASLHPPGLTASQRKECLWNLRKAGYQVGTGFMVGSPGQTSRHLAKDLLFIHELQPEMTGIGPFIPHHDTPFAGEKPGTLEQTLFLLGILRLMLPKVLLPATTALGTIDPKGREKGILAGANVVMPNLSPLDVRNKYLLYDNKIATGDEAAESRKSLERSMAAIGYEVVTARGDFPG